MYAVDLQGLRAKASAALAIFGAIVTVAAMAAPSTAAAASTPARCKTSALSLKLTSKGRAAAGSAYYNLKFTNTSNKTCSLFGYPGVSALRNGKQLGLAALRNHGVVPSTVVLKHGATARALLQVIDALNYPPKQCKPEKATQLKVYAPGAFEAKYISKTVLGCSNIHAKPSAVYLKVEAVR